MLNYIFCDSLNFDYTFHIEYSCNCQPISGSGSAYFERSPINFVDKFSCPIILFQGLEDKVCTKLHLTFWFFFFCPWGWLWISLWFQHRQVESNPTWIQPEETWAWVEKSQPKLGLRIHELNPKSDPSIRLIIYYVFYVSMIIILKVKS